VIGVIGKGWVPVGGVTTLNGVVRDATSQRLLGLESGGQSPIPRKMVEESITHSLILERGEAQ